MIEGEKQALIEVLKPLFKKVDYYELKQILDEIFLDYITWGKGKEISEYITKTYSILHDKKDYERFEEVKKRIEWLEGQIHESPSTHIMHLKASLDNQKWLADMDITP